MKAYTRKQKVIAKSSAEAELCAAALGASDAKGVQSMMRDLGFAVMPVLNIETTGADLCMFGLVACDDGGPGFVNASVRTIANARQVGVRLRSKCAGTHRHAQVNTNNSIEKEERSGTWVRQVAQAMEEQL